MKRTIRWIVKALASLLLLLLAAGACMLVYNRFDEPLTLQAQALLAPRPVGGKPEDNAYFALLGMRAPPGKEAQAIGIALDRSYFEAFANDPTRAEVPDDAPVLGAPELKLRRADALRCNWFEKDCAAQFRRGHAAIEASAADQAGLFSRYQQVLALPDYHDRPLAGVNEPVPGYTLFLEMDALAQARTVEACDRGDSAAVVEQLGRVNSMARRVAANAQTLVGKLVFAQVLRSNLALLNALLNDCPALTAQQAQALAPLVQPLTPAEAGLVQAADGELSLMARTFFYSDKIYGLALNTDGTGAASQWFGRLLDGVYQRQATANFLASRKPFFSLESHWLRSHKPAAEQTADSHTRWPSGAFWHDYIDNPTGHVLVAIATPDLGVYTDRMLDLDGYLRLTALHLQIVTGQLGDAAVPALLASQPARYGDPYTGQPMAWDADKRQLLFQGHGRASSSGPADGRFTVLLARRAG